MPPRWQLLRQMRANQRHLHPRKLVLSGPLDMQQLWWRLGVFSSPSHLIGTRIAISVQPAAWAPGPASEITKLVAIRRLARTCPDVPRSPASG